MAVNDLEYKELRLDLVDLTEGVVGSFLFYYDEEVRDFYQQRDYRLMERVCISKRKIKRGSCLVSGIYRVNFSWKREHKVQSLE